MIIKSFVLIEKNDRYLLIQEAGFKWRGKWFLPGGNVKKNEDPAEAVEREAEEEAGCQVKVEGIFFVKCYSGLFSTKLHLFYTGRVDDMKVKTFEDKHSIQAKWFTFEEIKRLPARQKMLKIIERHRKSKGTIPVKNFKLIYFKTPLRKLM
jgi:ADP-ribose pyrophosphatase YjhB (NUDIX family)